MNWNAKRIIYILMIILLLFAAGNVLDMINGLRRQHNLTVDLEIEDAPPELVLLTTALGGFRGLIVNYLWIRAMELQKEGKHFELVQLFDWIGRLQPRFETVWVYAGWNMSYNISVKFTTPHERWLWVERGIEIIRDEGLRYNPRNPLLYRELAWIYFHKIGHLLDEFHWDYKIIFADRMSRIVGDGGALLPYIAEFRGVTRDELLKDEDVSALARNLGALGFDPFSERFAGIVLGYEPAGSEMEELLADERWREPAGKLGNFIRYRKLSERLKLDPHRMLSLMEEIGPLDWRLAQSHALYWLKKGVEVSGGGQDVNHDRLILQCLISLAQNGRISRTPSGALVTEPDFRFIDATDSFYRHLIEKYDTDLALGAAHEHFLQGMVVSLYTYGMEEKARETYSRLRELRPEVYRAGLERFVLNRIAERVGEVSVPEMSSLIQGIIRRSLYELALGNDERAAGLENVARTVWAGHMEKFGSVGRMALPPFEEMREMVLRRALDGEFPEELIPLLRRRLGI